MDKAYLSNELLFDDLLSLLKSRSFDLQPTQERLCFPILQRIHHKMHLGVRFDNISTAGNLLINGHHRYICSQILNQQLQRNTWAQPSQITIYQWPDVEIDMNDWETIEMVERHNAKDAALSGLSIGLLRR